MCFVEVDYNLESEIIGVLHWFLCRYDTVSYCHRVYMVNCVVELC
jgi:hypothetical protein